MSEDKLYKFVRKDEDSMILESLIRENNEEHSTNYPTSVFDPSHVTECPRRMIYRANGCVSEKNISYSLIHNRMFIKKKWLDFLESCRSIKVIDRNVVTADCHYNISGKADAVLKIGDRVYVSQIHPVSHDEFVQLKKNGAFKKHVVELILYIWLTELKDGLLLYENQNTNDHMIFHVKQYEPIIRSVRKKCLKLMEDKIHGIVPPKPYESIDSNECVSCEFTKICWQEKKENA